MNVLVSDTSKKYERWVVVRTLHDVINLRGSVENLVFHKSSENTEVKIKYLTDISKKFVSCKIIYVCDSSKADKAIRMLVTGGDGRYIDDEFYLEDDTELDNLISDLPMIVDSTELASSNVLNDFFNRYIADGDSSISKGYLKVVKRAAIEMTESYHAKSLELIAMSETAADIFSNSVELVSQMREQQAILEKDLQNLKERKADVDKFSSRQPMGSMIAFFPTVDYFKSKVILRIKDMGRCPYFMSFMLGFRQYLEKIRNVRPKLIVVEQVGRLTEDIYKDFNWVTSSSKNDSRYYYGSVVFTNIPNTLVMDKLLGDVEYDTFIVVDRTYNYTEHILKVSKSRGNELYAVNGDSMIESLKLPRGRCFSSIAPIEGTMFTIPYFNEYPKRDDQRTNVYLRDCASYYEMLYSSFK